jgi:predicted outer membrane protein
MKTLLAVAFVLIAPAAYAADDAKPADKPAASGQTAAEQSYQEKAQEKALKKGKAWAK